MIGMAKRPKLSLEITPTVKALAAVQAVREIVGPEAELAGDGDHLGAGLGAQLAIAVQRLGGRADADLGEPRDVVDRRLRIAERPRPSVVALISPRRSAGRRRSSVAAEDRSAGRA